MDPSSIITQVSQQAPPPVSSQPSFGQKDEDGAVLAVADGSSGDNTAAGSDASAAAAQLSVGGQKGE